MTRSVAEYLQETQEFEDEYKKNFADILQDEQPKTYYVPEGYKTRVRADIVMSDHFRNFEELKKSAAMYGLLDRMHFGNYLQLVRAQHIDRISVSDACDAPVEGGDSTDYKN